MTPFWQPNIEQNAQRTEALNRLSKSHKPKSKKQELWLTALVILGFLLVLGVFHVIGFV